MHARETTATLPTPNIQDPRLDLPMRVPSVVWDAAKGFPLPPTPLVFLSGMQRRGCTGSLRCRDNSMLSPRRFPVLSSSYRKGVSLEQRVSEVEPRAAIYVH